ncbi:DUF3168 domain-containing protein [Nioella sp.]|uniref:DUF3168 domain-containing protein n=1 Tax=Nioella sp. TaxID=1912091 RepID=UPI00351152CA
MSYGMTAALQTAVYGRLSADAGLAAIVGGNVFDALPEGPPPSLYVTLGPEKARDRSDGSFGGAEHDFSIAVTSSVAGFYQAKQAAAAISDALLGAPLTLARGRVGRVQFLRAQAARAGSDRRIEIWFRARLDEDDS